MKCQALIDWLTFSVKTEKDPAAVIIEYLGMDPDLFQEAGSCLPGYQSAMRFSDIIVCYDPRENEHFKDMGVCVSMSGNGCRAFETMTGLTVEEDTEISPLFSLCQLLASDADVNISRIDIACDDREGYLCMDDIVRKVEANEVNSRMAKRSVVVSFNGTQRNGSTVYIGAESSDFRVRIYDKALEQGTEDHWIRVELVMRHENANAFVENLVISESVGKLAAKVINDKLSFIDRDDSNITRCTVCDWWTRFVDELEAVRLVAREIVQHPVEHIRDWIRNQVAPSLAIIVETLGLPALSAIYENGLCRLSPDQDILIQDYNSLHPVGA